MRKSTGAACAVLAATTVLGVSACSQVEPKVAFAKAYQATTSQQDMTQTVSMRTTAADIDKLVTAFGGDTATDPQSKIAIDTLKKVLPKLTITSKVHSTGGTLDAETDPKKLDQASTISVDGAGVEVLTVGGQPFMKVDVDGLGAKTGLFTGSQVKLLTAGMPPELSWINDVVDGRWIGFPAGAYENLLKSNQAGVANDPVKMKELRAKVQSSVEKNATFEKVDDTHINVSVKVKPFLKDVQAATKDAMPSASPSPTPMTDKDLEGLKDDAVAKVATTVENDKITEAVFDIPQMWAWFDESTMKDEDKAQFLKVKSSGFAGSVVTKMSTDPVTITKPADAKVLTDAELERLQQMMDSSRSKTPAVGA